MFNAEQIRYQDASESQERTLSPFPWNDKISQQTSKEFDFIKQNMDKMKQDMDKMRQALAEQKNINEEQEKKISFHDIAFRQFSNSEFDIVNTMDQLGYYYNPKTAETRLADSGEKI